MKTLAKPLVVLSVLGVLSPAASAATLLDGFEDTAYVPTTAAGESVTFAAAPSHTEGAAALNITYNYVAHLAWTQEARVEKVLAAPVDASGLTSISYDLRVPAANSSLILIMVLVDDQGHEMRIVDSPVFSAATAGFRTVTHRLSNLEKTRWSGGGKAANLRRVRKVWWRVQNRADIAAAGSFTFSLDNLRLGAKPALLHETVLDGFEGYADNAALAAKWQAKTASTAVSVMTANPFAGARSMRLTADIAGRWTNYLAETTLAAPADLSGMKYMRFGMFGDTKLIGYTPTAHLYLVDTAGNRAQAYVWDCPAAAEWSDVYLPFERDGIEPWSNSTTLAYGGNSCWREDMYDAGGWSANVNLASIAKIQVSIETQATGTYPVSGVNILIDSIAAGYETSLDTPGALDATLRTASAGQKVTLGYDTPGFGAEPFLNSAPNLLPTLPGTMVYSDDPESVDALGVLYRVLLPAGFSRTYLYHVNNRTQAAKITSVLQNAGGATAHVTFSRAAVAGPSTNYGSVGKLGVQRYYENAPAPAALNLAPGAAALLDATLDSSSAAQYQLMHSIHDFTSDQPLTFTALMLGASANTLSTFATQPVSPDDGHKREGTFAQVAKENTTPYPYDTAGGIGRVRIADWGTDIDPFLDGTDSEDGAAARLWGNYGITYRVRIAMRATDGRRAAVVVVPPSNTYGGYVRWQFPEGGPTTGQMVPGASTYCDAANNEAAVCAKLSPGAPPATLLLELIPAGSSYLPVDIHLVPFGDPAGVEESLLY
jgi:hypothetical protein